MIKKSRELVIFLILCLIMLMTPSTGAFAATEYSIDDIINDAEAFYASNPGTEDEYIFTLHKCDTIKGSNDSDVYFTVISITTVPYYAGHPDCEGTTGTFKGTFVHNGQTELEWICFGKDSTYRQKDNPGIYSLGFSLKLNTVTVSDEDGNPVEVYVLGSGSGGAPTYMTYDINYDANGGQGTIAPLTWQFTEVGKTISDGSGFIKDGVAPTDWCIAPNGDTNGNGIIDRNDTGVLIYNLSESLDLTGPEGLPQDIPKYAAESDTAKSSITLYALYDGTPAGGNNSNENNIDNYDSDTDKNATPKKDVPKTADTVSMLPMLITLAITIALSVVFYRKQNS